MNGVTWNDIPVGGVFVEGHGHQAVVYRKDSARTSTRAVNSAELSGAARAAVPFWRDGGMYLVGPEVSELAIWPPAGDRRYSKARVDGRALLAEVEGRKAGGPFGGRHLPEALAAAASWLIDHATYKDLAELAGLTLAADMAAADRAELARLVRTGCKNLDELAFMARAVVVSLPPGVLTSTRKDRTPAALLSMTPALRGAWSSARAGLVVEASTRKDRQNAALAELRAALADKDLRAGLVKELGDVVVDELTHKYGSSPAPAGLLDAEAVVKELASYARRHGLV